MGGCSSQPISDIGMPRRPRIASMFDVSTRDPVKPLERTGRRHTVVTTQDLARRICHEVQRDHREILPENGLDDIEPPSRPSKRADRKRVNIRRRLTQIPPLREMRGITTPVHSFSSPLIHQLPFSAKPCNAPTGSDYRCLLRASTSSLSSQEAVIR